MHFSGCYLVGRGGWGLTLTIFHKLPGSTYVGHNLLQVFLGEMKSFNSLYVYLNMLSLNVCVCYSYIYT